MKIYKNCFNKIISSENLFSAWDKFKSDKQKKPRASAVIIVSLQSKAPAPRTKRTIWARRAIIKTEIGISKYKIRRKVIERWFINFLSSPLEKFSLKTGKEAMAKETAKILIGTLWRLKAKLKIASEPDTRVEAIIVMTN